MKFEKLSINEIKDRKFIIPFYQREYTWDRDNLNALLHSKSKFIGNIVIKNDEIIDGQQRFMSIFLLSRFLDRKCFRISYAVDDEDNERLEKLSSGDFEKTEFVMQSLNEICRFIARKLKIDDIKEALNEIKFTITELPNHIKTGGYFEAMNANKVQLRQSDILKARFMEALKDSDIDVALIWECCEDLGAYFLDSARCLNKKQESKNTINELLSGQSESKDSAKIESKDLNLDKTTIQIKSIVDFDEFLAVVAKIIEPKMLLSTNNLVENFKKHIPPEKSEEFINALLSYRLVFDKFVFKIQGDNEYIFEKGDTKELGKTETDLVMIELLFYVQGSNEWLVDYLKFAKDALDFDSCISFLENLDNQRKKSGNLDQGTNTPHYYFYKLEYLLWKHFDKYFKDIAEVNRDAYRLKHLNSVEHIHPRSKAGVNGFDSQEILNNFGNLALLSGSRNSSLGNLPVNEKKERIKTWIKNGSVQSLKMVLALNSGEWNAQNMQKHGEEMKKLLELE